MRKGGVWSSPFIFSYREVHNIIQYIVVMCIFILLYNPLPQIQLEKYRCCEWNSFGICSNSLARAHIIYTLYCWRSYIRIQAFSEEL